MTVQEIIASTKITQIWIALGGDQPKHNRASAFWRGGDNPGAVSLDDNMGCWHDWVTDDSGGILDLIQKVLGGNRSSALKWLGELTRTPIDGHHPAPEQRRAYARRKADAEQKATDITHWRDALIIQTNQAKVRAVAVFDDQELGRAAHLCYLLENGSADQIVAEFNRHSKDNPTEVARLIGIGLDRQLEAEQISRDIVRLILGPE